MLHSSVAVTGRDSIPGAFAESVRLYGDRVAFWADGGLGKAWTYAEAGRQVDMLAAGLLAGSRLDPPEIGLISENRPEWAIAYLAILKAGGTVVPIDANLKPNEIRFIVEDAGLKVLFVSEQYEELLRKEGFAGRLFSFASESVSSWQSLMGAGDRPVAVDAATTAVLIYTSGTTGTPKAVELTHRNILSNLEGIRAGLCFDWDDVFLSVLPLHHTFEATCGFLTPVMCGASIVYARSLKSRDIMEDIGRTGVTVMCGVPLLYEKMAQSIRRGIKAAPVRRRALFHLLFGLSRIGWAVGLKLGRLFFRRLRKKAGLSTLRLFVSGGAAIPSRIAAFFNHLGISFFQGYGMTECSPVISFNRPDSIRFGSVGPPLPNVEVRIDDPDRSGVGEIVVRGENVTPGYRGNPEQTAALVRDGWLHTGDLGMLRQGRLWITGRAKNVIVSAAGKNIYPEEIETLLVQFDCVAEVVVFGRKKEGKQGEEVAALIVPDLECRVYDRAGDGGRQDTEMLHKTIGDVIADVNRRMADYKRIVSFDIQTGELEKTSTKKVKRFVYK
ncbi:MAG: AMP-dependent synthetase/ligase [Candidatus Zixiibacteriota bacterium]